MGLDKTISEVQSRMARRRNIISELESDYDHTKVRAYVSQQRKHYKLARAIRQEIKPLVKDQRLDKKVFDLLVTQRTKEARHDPQLVSVYRDPFTGYLNALVDDALLNIAAPMLPLPPASGWPKRGAK